MPPKAGAHEYTLLVWMRLGPGQSPERQNPLGPGVGVGHHGEVLSVGPAGLLVTQGRCMMPKEPSQFLVVEKVSRRFHRRDGSKFGLLAGSLFVEGSGRFPTGGGS